MADSTSRYRERDYRRVCDTCGMLRNISEMHFQDSLWVCTYDTGERTRTQLDKGNARVRPATIKPVPHPKPLDLYYPNVLETDDAAVFNFLSRAVSALSRYERVDSGAAFVSAFGGPIPTLGWAGRYLYDLIQEGKRTLLIPRAKTILGQIATVLQTYQQGFGLSPSSTRANSAFYGGFSDGSTNWVTNDIAAAGLALLYAYRVLGTATYIVGARAAASYLRNVQAIGSNGTTFTASDSGGTARLYTGSLTANVGSSFTSDQWFYPSALIALELWNELKTTDGDQSIGATAVVTGFDTTPSQLLSTSITDLRDCWSTGIRDSTGTLINGLSSTTPKEFFNAYPVAKTNFPNATGTGLWEYGDGTAARGMAITAQNFAQALSSLFNYEGATSQVTTVSDWLRTFTSNSSYETPDSTSTGDLCRSTTGTYDPTVCLASALQVRDTSAATTTKNATSAYDWGAFGLMSRIWSSRNTSSFRTSRLVPLGVVLRFSDGSYNDGLNTDRPITRGLSGLTMQTGYKSDVTGGIPVPYGIVRGRGGRGQDLEFDQTISIADGEISTFDFWRFTSIDDNDGLTFRFRDSGGEVPDGGAVTFYNATGSGLLYEHMSPPSLSSELPYWLIERTTTTLPVGYVISFVRDDSLGAWRQLWKPTPGLSSGTTYPLLSTNDAVRAAQYGRSFREVR